MRCKKPYLTNTHNDHANAEFNIIITLSSELEIECVVDFIGDKKIINTCVRVQSRKVA